jgi:hypothetical protein
MGWLEIIFRNVIRMYIYYEKAYDSVDRECIWIALRGNGLPVKIFNIIKE